MHPIVFAITKILSIYSLLLFIYIIMVILIQFNIINRHQAFVAGAVQFFRRIFEPILLKIRKFMPDLGPVDIAPIALFVLIELITYTIIYYFA